MFTLRIISKPFDILKIFEIFFNLIMFQSFFLTNRYKFIYISKAWRFSHLSSAINLICDESHRLHIFESKSTKSSMAKYWIPTQTRCFHCLWQLLHLLAEIEFRNELLKFITKQLFWNKCHENHNKRYDQKREWLVTTLVVKNLDSEKFDSFQYQNSVSVENKITTNWIWLITTNWNSIKKKNKNANATRSVEAEK